MTSSTLTLKQLRKMTEDLPGEVRGAVIRALRSTAAAAVGVVVEEIDSAGLVDSGGLRQSVHYSPLPNGAMVSVDAPHAPYLEYGTRPHWPPEEPILRWVHRKLGVTDEKKARGIAFAIRKKISVNGSKPRRYFSKAMRKVYRQILTEEIDRELNKL